MVFVAFGGEEPRGTGDLEHHFGSLHYVAEMSPAERRNLRGMVSMDRVGVGAVVPVASVGGTPIATRAALVRSAARLGIGVAVDPDNTASDHESFADAGLPAARLGSTLVRRLPHGRGRALGRQPRAAAPGRPGHLGLAAPSPLNRQKFANIRSAASYGTTRGAWSAPIR